MWKHRHDWYTTSIPINGEISKRDCPRDKYAPKGPDVQEPGLMVVCSKDNCLRLGIRPFNPNRRTVEIEV